VRALPLVVHSSSLCGDGDSFHASLSNVRKGDRPAAAQAFIDEIRARVEVVVWMK
jgi:hypothetical protein